MNSKYLEMDGVLDQLEEAIREQRPFSLVRVGDGENIVMSQETVWTTEQVLQERWAIKANLGQKGLRFPICSSEMKWLLLCSGPISSVCFPSETVQSKPRPSQTAANRHGVRPFRHLSCAHLPCLCEPGIGSDTTLLGDARRQTYSAGYPRA